VVEKSFFEFSDSPLAPLLQRGARGFYGIEPIEKSPSIPLKRGKLR
jgi:hypothetical protein